MSIFDSFLSVFVTTTKTLAKQYLEYKEQSPNATDLEIFDFILNNRYSNLSSKQIDTQGLRIEIFEIAMIRDSQFKFDEFVFLILSAETDILSLGEKSIASAQKAIGNTLNNFDGLPRIKFNENEFRVKCVDDKINSSIQTKKSASSESNELFSAIVLKMKKNGEQFVMFFLITDKNNNLPTKGNVDIFYSELNQEVHYKETTFDELLDAFVYALNNKDVWDVLDIQYYTDMGVCLHCKKSVNLNDLACPICREPIQYSRAGNK